MDEIYELCRKRALQWDHQYTNKAYKASPSEYLVWRGRALEAAFLADRSDISEELVRVESHLLQYRKFMADPEPAGRKLNFLLQEFNREFNTIGSKAGKSKISHLIVEVKAEIEKLREQVQNVE